MRLPPQAPGQRGVEAHAVQLAQQLLHDARPSIAAVDELAHARSPHGHQRKLRGRKEAVDGHQQQYRQESEPDHVL